MNFNLHVSGLEEIKPIFQRSSKIQPRPNKTRTDAAFRAFQSTGFLRGGQNN